MLFRRVSPRRPLSRPRGAWTLRLVWRRGLVAAIVALVGVSLGVAMVMTLAPGGWTVAKAGMLLELLSVPRPGSDFAPPMG